MPSSPAIIGHRGARGEAPENTLAGFRQAVNAGAQGIELDVRLSSDHHLVVLHDRNVQRTTGHRNAARWMTRAELGGLDARQGSPGWHSPTGVPSLEEVIDACPANMSFQLEVKAARRSTLERIADELIQLIDRRNLAGRVIVSSSHKPFLRELGRRAPHLHRGHVCRRRYRQPLRGTAAVGADWLIVHHSLASAALVRRARTRGLKISTWTVNDLAEAERLAELEVDSIITDFPSAMVAHFRGPGRNNRYHPPPPDPRDEGDL